VLEDSANERPVTVTGASLWRERLSFVSRAGKVFVGSRLFSSMFFEFSRSPHFGDGTRCISFHSTFAAIKTMAASHKWKGRTKYLPLITVLAFITLQLSSLIQLSGSRKTQEISIPWHHDTPLFRKQDTAIASTTTDHSCIKTLGKNGTWVQDWNFSQEYGQYSTPLVVPHGPFIQRTHAKFQPSTDAPFSWPSSWTWHDYSENCQVDYTASAKEWCHVLQSLHVTRILYFGDSLQQAMGKALLNQLGSQHVCVLPKPSSTTNLYELYCGDDFHVDVLLAKEGGGHGNRSSPQRLDFVFSNETHDFVTSNAHGSTLLVMNIGAHYHTLQEYKEDLDILLQTIDNFKRRNDTVFFRTTVPGHKGCQPNNPRRFNWTRGVRTVPLKRFQDYTLTTQYAWNLFFEYNTFTKDKILQQEQTTVRLLDVVNMTILRQDGHVGGADCLHYVSPGPIDWWNHLLYTLLKELAARDPET
jgi:hypothetical protein